jgi:putative transposase
VQRQATLTRMWWVKGEQPVIKMEGFGDKIHIYGVLHPALHEMHFNLSKHLRSSDLCGFLEFLLKEYPAGHLHIVLDNAPAHHSRFTEEFAAQHSDRIELIHLPTYSPKLNPIEKCRAYLRKNLTHNTYFSSRYEFKYKLLRFLVKRTKPHEDLKHFCDIYYETGPMSVLAMA